MSETRLFEAEDALVSILREAPELEGVEITNSAEPERAGEYVWVYKGASFRDFVTIGRPPSRLDEELTIQIRILVVLADGIASRERARELFEQVDAVLRENADLEDVVLFSRVESLSAEQVSLDDKRGFQIPMTFKAKARVV